MPAYPEGDPDATWTIIQLEAFAAENHISLTGLTKKADILAAIYTALNTEPVEAWGLDVIKAYATQNSVELTDDTDLEVSLGEVHAYWETETGD